MIRIECIEYPGPLLHLYTSEIGLRVYLGFGKSLYAIVPMNMIISSLVWHRSDVRLIIPKDLFSTMHILWWVKVHIYWQVGVLLDQEFRMKCSDSF